MSAWGNVMCGFALADETINFGTRAFAPGVDCIYEASTLATIHVTEKDPSCLWPVTISQMFEDGAAIAVDRTFIYFNRDFNELLMSVTFDAPILAMTFINGTTVCLGLSNFDVIRIDLTNKKWAIFPPELLPEVSKSSKFLWFFSLNSTLISVFKSGLILDLGAVNREIDFGDKNCLKINAESGAQFTVLYQPENIVGDVTACSEPAYNHFCSTGRIYFSDDENMHCWSQEGHVPCLPVQLFGEIRQIEVTADNRYLVCLTKTNRLFLICSHTMSYVQDVTEEPVQRFVLKNVCSVLFLTQSGFLRLLDLENHESVFEFQVTQNIVLFDKQMDDSELFIEASGDNCIDTMAIKMIEETAPDNRLDRLLRRGKFEQAREFSRIFSLNEEKVLKAEAQWLMGALPLSNRLPEDTLNSSYERLMKILSDIKDIKFVAEICMKTIAPDIKKMQKMVEYALHRVNSSDGKNQTNELVPIVQEIRALQLMLGTFLKVYGKEATPNKWLTFSTRNPILVCEEFITKDEMERATIVCKRHHQQIASELSYDMTHTLLHAISSSRPGLLSDFLRVFIPIILKSVPKAFPRLMDFVIESAKALEAIDPRNWPHNAEAFATTILNTINELLASNGYGSVEALAIQQSMSLPSSPVNRLESFLHHLKVLSVVLKEHNIFVSYDMYFGSLLDEASSRAFVDLLFSNVPEHGITKLITEFIPLYSMSLFKDISQIISSFVIGMIDRNGESIYMSTNYLYWEARFIAFINCISEMDASFPAIVHLAKFAQVPWSEQLSLLVDRCLTMKHRLISALEEEKKKIPQKIVLKKYGFCNNADMDCMRSLISYIYRSNGNINSMLEDGKQLVSHDETLRLDPYICLVEYGLNNDCLSETLDILQEDLDKNAVCEVQENVLSSLNFKLKISLKQSRKDRSEECCTKIRHILNKFPAPPQGYQSFLASPDHIKSALAINEEYGTSYHWSDLVGRGTSRILETCIPQLAGTNEASAQLAAKASNLSILLFEPAYVGLLELVDEFFKTNQCDKAVEPLRQIDSSSKVFKTHNDRITKLLTGSAISVLNKPKVISKEVFELLVSIANRSVVHTDKPSTLSNFLRLCKLYKTSDSKPHWSAVHTDPIDVSFFQLPDVVYAKIVSGVINPRLTNENAANDNLEETLIEFYSSLPKDLISLSRIVELNLLLFKAGCVEQSLLKEMKQFVSSNCKNVIINVLSNPRRPDLPLGLSILQHFTPDKILQWLCYVARSKRDMKFSLNMSLVVKKYCQMHESVISNDQEAAQYFVQLFKVSSWSLKAYRHGIPYKEALADTVEEKLRFLNRLCTVNDIELCVLEKYCQDMGLNVQECYAFYIKHLLLSWEPKYVIFKTSSGKSEIIYQHDTYQLGITCRSVMSKISNPQALVNVLLKDLWNQINTYYYEVFAMILEMASSAPSGRRAAFLYALTFLQQYTRIGPIQEEESIDWFSSNPGVSSLPEIANYRLPFRSCPFSQRMLQPEISLDTYTTWKEAPPFLLDKSINKDVICSFAISNLRNTDQSNGKEWNLRHCKGDLLERIMECVAQMENTETAVASLYFVVNHVMPPGIDQVEAAQKCYLKAERWKTETRTTAAIGKFARAEKKYFLVSTQHILYSCGLGKPEYLSLVSEPTRLIAELYNDPTISQRTSHKPPNINKAAEGIMALYELNPVKVMLELLVQWLHPESSLQSTLNDSILNYSDENDEDYISRACYMLLGNKNSAEYEKYLVAQAFPSSLDDTRKSHGVRLRALRILLAITTPEQLEQITARDSFTIRSYLQILDFISELEKFGLVYCVSSFESTRKEVIVDTLLRNESPPSVRLALKIYRCYSLTDTRQLSTILRLMINLGMISALEDALLKLSVASVDIVLMKRCWNSVLECAIRKVSTDQLVSSHDQGAMKKVIDLIDSCPDATLLDLEAVRSFLVKFNEDTALAYVDFVRAQS